MHSSHDSISALVQITPYAIPKLALTYLSSNKYAEAILNRHESSRQLFPY